VQPEAGIRGLSTQLGSGSARGKSRRLATQDSLITNSKETFTLHAFLDISSYSNRMGSSDMQVQRLLKADFGQRSFLAY
jgi:hypothetical protein